MRLLIGNGRTDSKQWSVQTNTTDQLTSNTITSPSRLKPMNLALQKHQPRLETLRHVSSHPLGYHRDLNASHLRTKSVSSTGFCISHAQIQVSSDKIRYHRDIVASRADPVKPKPQIQKMNQCCATWHHIHQPRLETNRECSPQLDSDAWRYFCIM